MDTPIFDFVQEYHKSSMLRLHMPGHKGVKRLGMEHLDITEINGADSLYEAEGIIAQSEANASTNFGCRTYYSTEGSSQCIRAMLFLIMQYAKQQGKKPIIAAGRNAHKTFLTGVALLDMDVQWLYPKNPANYLSCYITADDLEEYLQEVPENPVAVYLTSPDYLGAISDICGIAEVCHRHEILLVVDNAHGAYLKFLPESKHPIDLGADLCCDSAHKTLPVLTGGAYLHLSDKMESLLGTQVKNAMMMFGSTSPSYLILQSLDKANAYIVEYPNKLEELIVKIDNLKDKLWNYGYVLYGDEPLKLTICAKKHGYLGVELADILRQEKIEVEFADLDYLVLMVSAALEDESIEHLEKVLCGICSRKSIENISPGYHKGQKIISIRDAMLAASELLPIQQCRGRILAMPCVSCPPAVPILVCGEMIDEHAMEAFEYYGIEYCCVVI